MTDDPVPAAAASVAPAVSARNLPWRLFAALVAALALVAIVALVFAWKADQRVSSSERDLVRRQQDSTALVTEATLLAKQAQESARDATAKVALLEARLNEVAVQRSQLEDLIQSVARSRDENLVVDVESALRAAVQQSALTGSAEPVVAALKQGEDRIARANQPRLEPVRRAMARDLERARSANVADVAALSIKLDEAMRLVDELPLLSAPETRRQAARAANGEPAPVAPAASSTDGVGAWFSREFGRAGSVIVDSVWSEIRSLVRVTRIAHPEAMLVAPEQAFFLRENIKLRLLNARLALLSRQFDGAQADVRWAQGAIDRYFDRSAKRTLAASELLRQVTAQARQGGVARPDDTLAALATVSGGR
ncbi:MAG: uroporphyrinogen-III C-methyltransferase [Caldimonas sp.]